MNHGMATHVETCLAAMIEHVDLCRIADAIQGLVQRHRVVDAQLAHLLFADRHIEFVMGHISIRGLSSRN